MEIDYIPIKDPDVKVRKIELFIGDCRVVLDKSHAIYLLSILNNEVDKMVIDGSCKEAPKSSRIIEAIYRVKV